MAFDMSFGDGAGWGGDTSFATEASGKDSESAKLAEKLPIPAQIALLATLSEDKVVFGSMMFATAHTIGDLVEVIGDGQNKQFKLADPMDPSSTFTVMATGVMYDEGNSDGNNDDFPVGTRVMVAGKLRSFDGVVSMLTYKIRSLENDLEYDCFVKEAEIAKLYWEKNVPTLLRSGETSLDGTAAGRPVPRDGGGIAPSMSGASVTRNVSSISSHRPATATPVNKTFGDVRDKVLNCLNEQAKVSAETGSTRKDMHMGDISRAINVDIKEVKNALEFLSQEGTIYCTVDDEHYETV